MPAATAETPAVALSFANNFWGKDDAGVAPLLERMQGAKQTSDELKSFYGARASIEDEYARKLLNLCRKGLGALETGSLKTSLDTVRGEVESMAKQHQGIAAQMKTELEEPLAAFAGGMKERRKIIQNVAEKLLKTKTQQTQQVNKTRDKYEQECLKIKGYLAQGHMVMGQEERRNKAKLEKTQISLATSNTEYENAVKALDETTVRWNREWKAAADKFQDLEEERLDFTKSSLWTFANISSTVCVSDDASCEKIRLSLETMDVEKDIITFITERGTGQEIPDAPKYINFCRGDINDSQSEISEDENYSVAQFPRSINPAFRSSSPQPSTFESHHDPNSILANDMAHRDMGLSTSRETTVTPQKTPQQMRRSTEEQMRRSTDDQMRRSTDERVRRPIDEQVRRPMDEQMRRPMDEPYHRQPPGGQITYDASHHGPVATVPHDPYPMDGMTMLCRTGPSSDLSSQVTSARASSRGDAHSDYSNPTSFSSQEPPSGKTSPTKHDPVPSPTKQVLKKKSGFFQNHSPFRRKSTKELQAPSQNRNTWHSGNGHDLGSPTRRYNGEQSSNLLRDRTASPEPIDANASLALGVGQNVLPVTTPDTQRRGGRSVAQPVDEIDPIAAALAELKGVGKVSSVRMSADRYHGIATPAPDSKAAFSKSVPSLVSDVSAGKRGTPPPSYQQPAPVSRLGVPPPAVTSRAMKEATDKVTNQTRNIFGEGGRGGYSSSPNSRQGTRGSEPPRSVSPAPGRSASPQPRTSVDSRRMDHRSVSPNPYGGQQNRSGSRASMGQSRGSEQGYYRHASPHGSARGASPASFREQPRPQSSYGGGDMAVQLAPAGDDSYGSQRGRGSSSQAMGLYDGGSRQRSKSVADPSRQYTRDGRPIMHFARALYMYQAIIPEELGFSKGDYLAVLRHQDDGWWEAEVHNSNGRVGLVPSNYLQPC